MTPPFLIILSDTIIQIINNLTFLQFLHNLLMSVIIIHIQIRKQANTNSGGLCTNAGENRRNLLFRYERFYQFLTSVLRHQERDTILTMLTIPNASHILWCVRSLSVEIRKKNQLHLQRPNLNFSTDSFSKSSNSQDHLFRAWRHPHSSPIYCLGINYDSDGFHILCARA